MQRLRANSTAAPRRARHGRRGEARAAPGQRRAQRARARRQLLDPGTFIESGLFGTSARASRIATARRPTARSPASARSTAASVAVVANDFTVMGASSSATNGRKIGAHEARRHAARAAAWCSSANPPARACPITWARAAWARCSATTARSTQRMRETPWASATLGLSYGSSSWYAVLSDFCVMRKGAVLAVSSALLASLAIKRGGRSRGAGRLAGCTPRRRASPTSWSTPMRRRWRRSSGSSPICRPTTTRRRPMRRCRQGSGDGMARHRRAAAREAHAGLRRAQDHPRHGRQGQLVRAEGRASARWR